MLTGHNSTLEVASAEFAQDTGTFTCQASNSVGSGQATARVFVDNVEADKHGDGECVYCTSAALRCYYRQFHGV